jgi:signal transduction histidine kinase
MNSSNISINEFNQKLTKKIRERILVYSVLILSPLFILIFLYSDFRTNALALDPISNQALQGISLGDAISIDRASKATLFLPRALFSKIILSDGTCISFFEKTSEIWEDKVTASCHEFRGELYYPLTKKLVDSQGENIGVMVVGFAFPWIYLVFIPIFILISSLLIYYIVRNSAIHGINRITKIIEDFPLMIKSEIPEHFEIAEIENAYLEIVRLRNVEVEHVKFSALHRLAQQVSHDIASPLSALEMVSSQLASLPEDTRIIIRNSINRIRDISHSLLKKDKGKTFLNSTTLLDREEGSSSEVTLLSPVLESVIAEKRVQYRDYLKINIFFDQTRESYGLFSKIDIVDFTRSISNLINNSIELCRKAPEK